MLSKVSKLQYLFILVSILCKYSVVGFKCNAKPNLNPQFDSLLFVQQWPVTFCESLTNKEKECKLLPRRGIWTIHGIWPTRSNANVANQPNCCDSAINLDVNGLQPIKEQLKRNWPSVDKDNTDEEFWKYEWLKHGTCGVSINGIDSYANFFNRALIWLAEYNMTSILAKSNIVPDYERSYKLLDIHAAIKRVLNKNPWITCYINRETGEQYLNEIRICFDRQLSIMDCDGINTRTYKDNVITNCLNKPINYRGGASDHSGWFAYVAYFGLIVFVVVICLLMRDANIRRRFFPNAESLRLFNR